MELYLLRHPPVKVALGTCYGQTDLSLVDDWEKFLSPKIKDIPQNFQIYSSDLQRCSKVASYLKSKGVITDSNLREIHFGDWEGQLWDLIPKHQIEDWNNHLDTWSLHQGENFYQLKQRVIKFLKPFKETSEPTLIVTHAGWIRALLAHILDIKAQQAFQFNFNYGSLSHLTITEQFSKINFINN